MAKYIDHREASFVASVTLVDKQYYAVGLDAAHEGQVVLANAQTVPAIGFVQNEVVAGDVAQIILPQYGTYKCVYGGTVAVGDKLTADSAGKLIATSTATDRIVGIAKEAGSANEIHEFICALKP